jgi:outer membrane receptor for ferrienterochelin and colicin
MRFFIILLFLPFTGFAQSLLGKTITLSPQQGTAGFFLQEMNEQLHGAVSYSSHVINLSAPVNLTGREKTVENYLVTILKGQRVKFIEENNKIYLLPERKGNKITISGYVTEKVSGERLIGASVFFPSLQRGTTTNAYGFFSITVTSDSTMMQVSHIGYEPFEQSLLMQQDEELSITLQPVFIVAEPVVIKSDNRKNIYSTASGKTNVQPAFIKSLPAMMGETDVLRSLQLLPGIQAGNEGSSGLNVRGGSADQNLILLDGVPVYNASHAFGLFSVFNADVVNHVDVLKTAFPASYGGRLSSVIDVYLKEGDLQQFHGEGGIGLLFSKLTLEGPLKKGRSSFLISGRRTYADLLLKPILRRTENETGFSPFFTDLNVKMNFAAGKKDHIYLSAYLGKDNFTVSENVNAGPDSVVEKIHYNSGVSWGNLTAMARVNHVFSKKLFSNFTLTHSRYRFNLKNDETHFAKDNNLSFESRQHYFSGIRDWTVKTDVDYLPAPDHFVKTGFSATLHSYRPGVNNFFLKDSVTSINSRYDNQSSYSGEYDLYVEDDWRFSEKIKMNLGVRMSAFAVKRTLFSSVQPRINILYKPLSEWTFKVAYSTMNQFIHLLTNSSIGLPTDLWLPVTEKLPPQTSNQVSAGAFFRPHPSIDVSMEVYYKVLKNVIDYGEEFGFASAYENWETMLETGKGKTYGAEWMVQKTKGKLTGVASYTLSKSNRKFEHINEGKTFPYKYDKRHEIKTSVLWQPSNKFEFSSAWVFSTGNAVSLPVGWFYNPDTYSYIDIYKGRNNFHMPNYHRMDLSFRFIKKRSKYTRTWALNVYNVYNHFNPFYRYKAYDDNNNIVFKDVSVFPVLPSFSYQFKF